jgi:hypothetical protein
MVSTKCTYIEQCGRKACKAYQNKILFSLTVRLSGASVLPTRCTTDTSI